MDELERARLPLYPIPLGQRLKAEWIPHRHEAFLSSRFVATVDPLAGWYWRILWDRAMQQDPAGSLPTDDVELAYLSGLGRDVAAWREVRELGALDGWFPALCCPPDGDARPSGKDRDGAHSAASARSAHSPSGVPSMPSACL